MLLLRSGGGQVEARALGPRRRSPTRPRRDCWWPRCPTSSPSLLVGALDPAQAPGSVRTGLRPKPVGAGAGGPPPDPGRPARRRRTDRAAASVVAVVALLLAAVEGARAATADGSWIVVVLALLVAVGMGVLAVRVRRAPARPPSPEDRPLASPEDGPPPRPRTARPSRPRRLVVVPSPSRVVVLDYGFGNVRSAVRALEKVGAQVELTADRRAAEDADGLVVPGVGAFEACMTGLRAVRGDQVVDRRLAGGRPVLGHLRRHAGDVRRGRRARPSHRGAR